MKSNRRKFIKNLGLATVGGMVLPMMTRGQNLNKNINNNFFLDSDKLKKYSVRAREIVKEATCIDMLGTHGDNAHKRNGLILSDLWESVPASFTQKDYEFVKSCGIDIFGWGNMIPTYEGMLQFMATQNGIVASNPDYFTRIDTKEKLKTLNSSHKIGLLMTNQNSNHFRTLDDINLFYSLGQRVSQLTYNGKNKLGCGAFENVDTGITEFGKKVVQRMNVVGMGVDVSHCADKTTLGGIDASSKPVLITHGSCRSLAKGVARAKTDDAIKAMAKTGGVIGIPILRFMVREKEPVHIDHFLNHIDHVTQLVGIDHVGIGSDQGLYTEDAMGKEYTKHRLENAPAKYQCHTNEDYLITIDKLNHPNRTYDIADGLLKRGYKDVHVKKVLGENFKRALIEIFND